jgi:hypothetical protein
MFISYRNVVLDLPWPVFTIIHRGDLCRYCVLLSLLTLTNDVVDCGVHPGLDADTNRNADRWCRPVTRPSLLPRCATGTFPEAGRVRRHAPHLITALVSRCASVPGARLPESAGRLCPFPTGAAHPPSMNRDGGSPGADPPEPERWPGPSRPARCSIEAVHSPSNPPAWPVSPMRGSLRQKRGRRWPHGAN